MGGDAGGGPEYFPGPPTLLRLRPLQLADVFHNRLTPTVDVHPLTVADAVLVAGYVDQVVPLPEGVRTRRLVNQIAILLVGDHNDPVSRSVLFLADIVHHLSQKDSSPAKLRRSLPIRQEIA